MFAFCCLLPSVDAQKAELQAAPPLTMPILVDSNSPAYWNDGQLVLINSFGTPFSTTSSDQFALIEGSTGLVVVDRTDNLPMWIESVFRDTDGSLYAWYHHEPGGVCPSSNLTAPKIGALVSRDNGRSFTDLGIVLSSGDAVDCSAKNGFFAGGHGDFSVIYDADHGNFYFLFGNYGGSLARQGVSIARMSYADRDNPVGNIWKYSDGGWNEPGISGQVTPILAATVAWQESNADSFWGPSVHWNSFLKSYVILLNRACCAPKWPQEGIYISFNTDLDNPGGWSKPERILSASDIGFSPGYYPQVLGLGWEETDTLAGEVARLYVKGFSKWEITFSHTPPAPDAP
jgi:hypothetical protein